MVVNPHLLTILIFQDIPMQKLQLHKLQIGWMR